MRRFFSVFFLFSLLIMSGCVSMEVARFSPDEIKGFTPEMQEHIRKGEVVAGMTAQQVRFSWGSPGTINVLSPTTDGKYREEWVYSRIVYFKSRLIFIDGKLTHIITNEPGVVKVN